MELPTVTNPTSTRQPGILELSTDELRDWFVKRGMPNIRSKQIRRWLIEAGADAFTQMTDLPIKLREELGKHFRPFGTEIVRHLHAADHTHKLLLQLPDKHLVECVLIQEADRRTACISTQVGCGMGCVFCASGLNGVERNLQPWEILEQLLRLRNLPDASGETARRLTHIVVMGMGEPLANMDALLQTLTLATNKTGLGMSARHVTISTVGLPAKIRQLADRNVRYHLAVSLHAPNEKLRSQIVPTNESIGLAAILEAADYFFDKTGRQVTYEYVLLGELNDRSEHAKELSRLLRNRQAHVNLIPFNDVEGLPYRRPTQPAITTFIDRLRAAGISVKVRKRKGSEIDAACGQLRRSQETTTR